MRDIGSLYIINIYKHITSNIVDSIYNTIIIERLNDNITIFNILFCKEQLYDKITIFQSYPNV